MKIFFSIVYLFLIQMSFAQEIWNSNFITFSKASLADWTLEENQDRITDNVWLTRADSMGLFNIRIEDSYENFVSPSDTEWAMGTTEEIDELEFTDWKTAIGGGNFGIIENLNEPMVLHLISDDIYIDISITSWSIGATGGKFIYERASQSTLNTTEEHFKKYWVSPNPAHDQITVAGIQGINQVEIRDHMGSLVLSRRFRGDGSLDISKLPQGLYFLTLNNNQTTKFAKK